MGTITLSDQQQRRAEILARYAHDKLTTPQAAGLLGVTDRQARRLRARYQAQGIAMVVHGNTGRPPANKTSAELRERLVELAAKKGRFHDFNTCHLHDLLQEEEGIAIGRSTLDRLLCEDGVRKRKCSRPRRVFGRRERRARHGEMLLIDGSLHDGLEGRDARYRKLCLLGAIDDAQGTIEHLSFWPTECQAGYIRLAREITVAHGIPMSFYHDRHTILCSPKEPTIEDELAGKEPMSPFEAILSQLGAEPIKAMTPQAKGRIERLWKTLQDRLVKEMRLAGVCTLEEANAFLPRFVQRYNARFGHEPRESETAWVAAPDLDLPFYFAAKEERVVKSDHTLRFLGTTLQIKRKRGERSLSGTRVTVHLTPEGERYVYAGKERLRITEVEPSALPKSPPAEKAAPRPEEERKAARRRQMAHLHVAWAG